MESRSISEYFELEGEIEDDDEEDYLSINDVHIVDDSDDDEEFEGRETISTEMQVSLVNQNLEETVQAGISWPEAGEHSIRKDVEEKHKDNIIKFKEYSEECEECSEGEGGVIYYEEEEEKYYCENPEQCETSEKVEEQVLCDVNKGSLFTSRKDGVKKGVSIKKQRNEKPYICDYCDYSSSLEHNLIRHKILHIGQTPFKCTTCNKKFSRNENLNRHERTHSGEKPFVCTMCGKEFSDRGNLNRHERMHNGVKPHTCETCNKTFPERGKLTRHQKVHTHEKPYECPTCKKKFSSKVYLNTHRRTHSPKPPSPEYILPENESNLNTNRIINCPESVSPENVTPKRTRAKWSEERKKTFSEQMKASWKRRKYFPEYIKPEKEGNLNINKVINYPESVSPELPKRTGVKWTEERKKTFSEKMKASWIRRKQGQSSFFPKIIKMKKIIH